MKLDHEKKPSSMVRPHGPWCKRALRICEALWLASSGGGGGGGGPILEFEPSFIRSLAM